MIMNYSNILLRHVNRRVISAIRNASSHARRVYFSFSVINRGVPNLKYCRLVLPCNYSTASVQVQVQEPDKTGPLRLTMQRYYKKIIENDQDYHGSVFQLETVQSETKNSTNTILLASRELIKHFQDDISLVSEEKLIHLKNLLNEEKKSLTYYELAEVIHNICSCIVEDSDKIFQDLLMEIAMLLDTECLDRFHSISRSEKIFLADLWCNYDKIALNASASTFIYKVKWKLFDWMSSLSKTEMAMLFYLIAVTRSGPKCSNDFRNYFEVEKMLPFFTIEEIGLICFAYKQIDKRSITSEGVDYILERLNQEIQSCSEQSLYFISKILRTVLPMKNTFIYSVQQNAANLSDKLSPNSLLDVLLISVERTLSADKSLVEATLRRIKESMNDVSFPNLSRFFYALAILNIRDEELFQLTAEKLKANKTFYSSAYSSLLKSLVIFNVFLDDIISEILNEELYTKIKGTRNSILWGNLCFLDMSMAIERPDLKYERLSEKKRKQIFQKIRFNQIENKRLNPRLAGYWMEDSLTRIYGTNKCFSFISVLPHFMSNTVVLKLDKNLQGQEIPESWKTVIVPKEIIRPLDMNHYWLVLFILKRFFYSEESTLNLNGAFIKRQIRALGFLPLAIRSAEFTNLEDEPLRDQLIENKIKETIQEYNQEMNKR